MEGVSNLSTSLPASVTVFLITAVLVGVRCYLIVVLTCISLKANDVKLILCLLLIFTSSLEKCLLKSLVCVKIFIYFWLCWVFAASRGLFSGCRPQALHCGGFSRVSGLSCSMARGIFLTRDGTRVP